MGWLGNGKNTSAAYLTGFLLEALKAGITSAVLDIGLNDPQGVQEYLQLLKELSMQELKMYRMAMCILPPEGRIKRRTYCSIR